MLKITTIHDDGKNRVLKLEGKLLAGWVEELRDACRLARTDCGQLQLDLRDLSFVDDSGIRVLHELIRQNVRVTTASPFVSELLKEN
jgi:anti-anti-sigma regulatory factor